ncbi:MAG: hypothetical protein SVO26_01160 [Chloroflexota bacterium]|nr:hypothetical protein [Chloroflexota bacterium]
MWWLAFKRTIYYWTIPAFAGIVHADLPSTPRRMKTGIHYCLCEERSDEAIQDA